MAALIPEHFTPQTPAQTINNFLQQLSQKSATWKLYPRVVSYKSKQSKELHIQCQGTEEGRADYNACDPIHALKSSLRVTGTIIWLSASLFRIGQSGADNNWHAYIMVYYNREVVIVDPDYKGKTGFQRNVRDFAALGLCRELLGLMTGEKTEKVGGGSCWGRAVKRVRIGHSGYGIPGQKKCMTMAGQWLNQFVEAGFPVGVFDSWEVIKM